MPLTKHIHKLKKHKYKTGNVIFHCVLPDCYFKIEAPLALGKESLCHMCGEPFIMNEYTLKLSKPHCVNCGKREVRDSDGRKRYVRRQQSKVLIGVADGSADNLRSRLESVTGTIPEDDI
jgi:hypothetical protein